MSADNRSTHTDALETLGKLIGPEEKRDAIHLGVEPVIAGERLRPGERIAFFDGDTTTAYSEDPMVTGPAVGIVDPFLTAPVRKGERFWLVVLPRQITSLRHVWTHPAFGPAEFETRPFDEAAGLYLDESCPRGLKTLDSFLDEEGIREEVTAVALKRVFDLDRRKEQSRLWIERYVVELNSHGYEDDGVLTYDELMDHARQHAEGGWNYLVKRGMLEGISTKDEFWHHYEIVTDTVVDEDERGNFFSCSC